MATEVQIETVKRALELERAVAAAKREHARLSSQSYSARPAPPKKRQVQRKPDPPIVPTIKFHWGIFILSICLLVLPFVYYFGYYRPKRNREIEEIRNSPEYKKQCADLEAEYQRECAEAEREYREAMEKYNNVTLPEYEKKRKEWTEQHNKDVKGALDKLTALKKELGTLYDETKIVPSQYRTIDALAYIYETVSTSDYSIREAIDAYDKSEQRKLDEARLREQQQANILAERQNRLADEQNDLLNEQNRIADKARKEANLAAAVGAVQRHKINKTLKGK